MQETDMKEKLQKIIEAYDELQAKMGDPAVLADQKEYNRLAKEYASQGPLAKKAAEYVAAMDDLEAAKEMLSDADMKEFAQEEIASIEAKLPQLEEDIKFMLIPADPADEKDIIVEIRAAGGLPRPAATRPPFLPATSTRCTSASPRPRAGRPRPWTPRRRRPAASRRSSSR